MYRYPYASRLRKELKNSLQNDRHRLWDLADISSLVASITNPVVEIGGPTQDGFYFLHNVQFNSKPVITNVSSRPLPFSPDAYELAAQVENIVDATRMPYSDQSIGIFLMSAMSISSDWWVELSDTEKEESEHFFEAEFENARFETGLVAAGILDASAVQDALRIKIFKEVTRCLDNGGLFFTDGSIEEIIILQKMGFELLACLQTTHEYGIYYEFVVVKRA
jgi:hypothetical protein